MAAVRQVVVVPAVMLDLVLISGHMDEIFCMWYKTMLISVLSSLIRKLMSNL